MNAQQKKTLLAIKIGSRYGVLENMLFRFDSELKIDISDLEITIRYNQEYIPDFFGKNISSIAAIVGPNGVGKTTLLNYVKTLFIKEKSDLRQREHDIILFKQGESILIYLNEKYRGRFEVLNETGFSYDFAYYKDYPKVYNIIKSVTSVFYANSLDIEQRDTETTNFYNVSSSFLMNFPGKINSWKRGKLKSQTALKRYKYTEFKRQVEFLDGTNWTEYQIPFKSQTYIEIDINEVLDKDYTRLERILKRLPFSENEKISSRSQILSQLYKSATGWKSESYKKQRFEAIACENILYDLLSQLFSSYEEIIGGQNLGSGFFSFLTNRLQRIIEVERIELWQIASNLNNLYTAPEIGEYFIGSEFKESGYFKIISNVEHATVFLERLINEIEFIDERYVLLGEDSTFSKIVDDFFATPSLDFINLKWPRMSAGEESMLSFYARLNAIVNYTSSEDLLLLIDEGDLYYHPEWQRKYIYYLLNYLATVKKNIQIIYTTHSPFLVSDLPKESLIILGKKDDNHDDYETFGANLYTLFSKAFFLEESSTSEFARQKIKTEILDKFESMTDRTSKKSVFDLINKVGEPVLKNILLKRFSNKTNDKNN